MNASASGREKNESGLQLVRIEPASAFKRGEALVDHRDAARLIVEAAQSRDCGRHADAFAASAAFFSATAAGMSTVATPGGAWRSCLRTISRTL